MEITKGIWTITDGKNDRVYIKSNDESKIMHPEDLCGLNGLGMYGHENLKDLTIALLRFQNKEVITAATHKFKLGDIVLHKTATPDKFLTIRLLVTGVGTMKDETSERNIYQVSGQRLTSSEGSVFFGSILDEGDLMLAE